MPTPPRTAPLAHRYLIATGSNLGDRAALLAAAVEQIGTRLGNVLAVAPVYATAPIGAADQMFYNSALVLATDLDPEAVLTGLLAIETAHGRIRRERWGNRSLDLDIILWQSRPATAAAFASRQHRSPTLDLPHPQCLLRDFVLVPAATIAPDWLHPVTGRSLQTECHERGYKLVPL